MPGYSSPEQDEINIFILCTGSVLLHVSGTNQILWEIMTPFAGQSSRKYKQQRLILALPALTFSSEEAGRFLILSLIPDLLAHQEWLL
jgi:hypothetical protein